LKLNGFGAFKFFSYTDAPHFGLYSVLWAFKMPFQQKYRADRFRPALLLFIYLTLS